jgi:rfaE bifunctional protein nucleotidyltransferase chain/domain
LETVAKIVPDHRELAEVVGEHKRQGKTIVLTNGAFDLLHVGHLRSLIGAKGLGDLLVVAVNSDRSVRRNKGMGRPVVPLADRMELLAALECVDYVTVFDAVTISELILLLKPDIHAKGTDYTPETDPEREALASYGGRTCITGDSKDHSVTDLIGRIRHGR